jgi:hypothetical protein
MSVDQPILSKDGLDVFQRPQKNHTYCGVIDIAAGVEGDSSTIQMIDITETPYRIVAKYKRNDITPLLFPTVIFKVATEYNNAFILIETNVSDQVAQIMHQELEYENILMVSRANGVQSIGGGFGGQKSQLGVNTDKRVKRIGCHNFKAMVEEDKLLINDPDTISEISTFIEKRGSYEADEGYHDDLVMPLVLFGWLTTQSYFKELNNINMRKIMYEKQIKAIEEDLTPFGFYDDGKPEADPLNF